MESPAVHSSHSSDSTILAREVSNHFPKRIRFDSLCGVPQFWGLDREGFRAPTWRLPPEFSPSKIMSGFQISVIVISLVLTAALFWWLGRRGKAVSRGAETPNSVAPVPALQTQALPVPIPEEITNKEDLLHQRLAKAAADMVMPLESFFSCGVELNLKTASLTRDLLAKLPPKEAGAIIALQSGLNQEGLENLSKQSGYSLVELEALRKKFVEQTAAALLPKIKSGLSSEPEVKPAVAPTKSKVSALTERLTLSTESEDVAILRRKYADAKELIQQLTTTHVPKTRLDSLQDEYAQQRQTQIQLNKTIEELQGQLQSARDEVAALPVAELDELRAKLKAQEEVAGKLESTVGEMQSALNAAMDQARAAADSRDQLQAAMAAEAKLAARCEELDAQLRSANEAIAAADRSVEIKVNSLTSQLSSLQSSHVPATELEALRQELAAKHDAHAALGAQHAELHEALQSARAQLESVQASDELAAAKSEAAALGSKVAELENKLAEITATHLPKAQLENLQMEFAAKHEESAALRARLEELECELQVAREAAAGSSSSEELESIRSALFETQSKLQLAEESIAQNEAQHAAQNSEHAAALAKIEELESGLAALREKESAASALETELAAAKAELATMQVMLEEMERSHASAAADSIPKSSLENLQMEFAAKHEAHAALAARQEEMASELASLQAELDEANNALADSLKGSGASAQLAEELELAEIEAREAREALASLESEMESAQLKISALEEARAASEGDVELIREELEQATVRASQLEEEIAELRQQEPVVSTEAVEEADSLKEELANSSAKIAELEGALAELRERENAAQAAVEELNVAKAELATMQEMLEEMERSHASAAADFIPKSSLENLQMEFAAKHEAHAALASRQEEMESELASLREELDEANNALADSLKGSGDSAKLSEELELAEIEAREARESIAQLESELESAQLKLSAMEESRGSSEEQVELMREELEQATARAAQLEEEIAELRQQEQESQQSGPSEAEIAELAALREQVSIAEEEVATLRAQVESLETEKAETPKDEAYADLEQEMKIAQEAHARAMAELEALRTAHAAIPADHAELATKFAELEESHQAEMKQREALEAALQAGKDEVAKLKAEMEAQRQGTVLRSDYESLRHEMDKARNDLSTALSRYANLQQRFNSIDKAASIEKLKAGLAQEEKAHGVLRIQYRNLESRLYEAVGGRKRVETEIKTISKERDDLLAKLKAVERSSVARVKVTLPPEIANPTLPEEGTEGNAEDEAPAPQPKRRVSKKKAKATVEETDAPEAPSEEASSVDESVVADSDQVS